MFFISLISFIYSFLSILAILLILIQKGKGGLGLGNFGGGNQLLFGGSGGQDFFQKITWILCAILLFGAFFIGILKDKYRDNKSNINIEKKL